MTTLTVVADTMTTVGHNNAGSVIRGDVLVAFGPEHAHTIASGGLSKRHVQQFLFERARNKVGTLKLRAMCKEGNWPDWVDRADDEALCPIVGAREDIHIVVTGGPGSTRPSSRPSAPRGPSRAGSSGSGPDDAGCSRAVLEDRRRERHREKRRITREHHSPVHRPGRSIAPGKTGSGHASELTALQATKGVVFRATEPGHFHDWHNAPRRQYVITLEGEVEIGLGDGTVHRFGPGHATLAEDLTGQGHTTRVVGKTRRLTATIHLTD